MPPCVSSCVIVCLLVLLVVYLCLSGCQCPSLCGGWGMSQVTCVSSAAAAKVGAQCLQGCHPGYTPPVSPLTHPPRIHLSDQSSSQHPRIHLRLIPTFAILWIYLWQPHPTSEYTPSPKLVQQDKNWNCILEYCQHKCGSPEFRVSCRCLSADAVTPIDDAPQQAIPQS